MGIIFFRLRSILNGAVMKYWHAKWLLLIALALVLASCRLYNHRSGAPIGNVEIPVECIPTCIVAYAYCLHFETPFYSGRYQEIHQDETPLSQLYKSCQKIDAIADFGVVSDSFIVRNNPRNAIYGFEKLASPKEVPLEKFLFVTEPISSFGNRVIVITSSVSPERTSFFAVGSDLSIERLFPTFDPPLGSIYGVKVVRPGKYLLYERWYPGDRSSKFTGRTSILDLRKILKGRNPR